MVEHNLAKVRVASSSLVSRSRWIPNGGTSLSGFFFEHSKRSPCPGGGIGRHAGLKILWPVMAVRVQVPPGVLNQREKQSESKVLTSDFLFSFCSPLSLSSEASLLTLTLTLTLTLALYIGFLCHSIPHQCQIQAFSFAVFEGNAGE